MTKNKTQTTEVLKYLKNHKRGITSLQAIELFGVTRLADIIFRLRKAGYDIITEQITKKNSYGHTTTYACYKLAA